MSDEILQINHLKKYFKTPKGMLHAVDDVSFSIDRGKTLGIVGESGCGKSTLGRTVIRLLEPTEGQIIFDGKDVSAISKRQAGEPRKEMQMVFQDPYASLNPRFTVSQAIAEPLKIFKLYSGEELENRVEDLMKTVGLAMRFKNAYPHELDGGRRQRIGIARALALDPKFIVCDEPVSALDVSIQAQVLNLLMDLQQDRGLTYMFITHDLSVVKHISDEICVMYLGNVVEKASSSDLFRHQLHPYTKALLSAIPRMSAYKEPRKKVLRGEITTPIEPKPGCRFAARCEYATEICTRKNPVLEEIQPGHIVACYHTREINHIS